MVCRLGVVVDEMSEPDRDPTLLAMSDDELDAVFEEQLDRWHGLRDELAGMPADDLERPWLENQEVVSRQILELVRAEAVGRAHRIVFAEIDAELRDLLDGD